MQKCPKRTGLISVESMALLYNTIFFIFTVNHLVLGLSHLFRFPPYDPAQYYVNGRPGDGETGLEKLFILIVGLWYSSLTMAMILAFVNK